MTMFFTSDHHFGHARIISLCRRPFSSVDEMNEAMIEAWNATVRPRDIVWHLGDFSYKLKSDPDLILKRLNGRKKLVPGNHDNQAVLRSKHWEHVDKLPELCHLQRRIVLSHYALRTWHKASKGALHLFGHSHGSLPPTSQSCDVGVDVWNFRPVTLEEIEARMAQACEIYAEPIVDDITGQPSIMPIDRGVREPLPLRPAAAYDDDTAVCGANT